MEEEKNRYIVSAYITYTVNAAKIRDYAVRANNDKEAADKIFDLFNNNINNGDIELVNPGINFEVIDGTERNYEIDDIRYIEKTNNSDLYYKQEILNSHQKFIDILAKARDDEITWKEAYKQIN